MNKKYLYIGIGIAVILLLIFTIPKYMTRNVTASGVAISGEIEKIEIYHFHGTNQCYSCKTVGAYAEETINTYFSNELKSGKIIFGHINGELPENSVLVKKYGATGSSLWIGTYFKDGTFKKEENVNVWYKIDNKQGYIDYLKSVIETKLSGE
ncbi:MAG: nitrophenyl compound nitroreductase subunit ArsF family protein [Candidatus Pacearchaeota archaeon]